VRKHGNSWQTFDFCKQSLFVLAWLCDIPCHSAAMIKHRTGPSSKQAGRQASNQAGRHKGKQAGKHARLEL